LPVAPGKEATRHGGQHWSEAMKIMIAIVGCLFISGCMQAQDPKEVAQQYWQAMQAGDYARARAMVSTSTQSSFDEYANMPDANKPVLSAVALLDSQTIVPTVINTGNTSAQFNTVLVMQNGQWVIDADKTVIPPPRSELEQRMKDMAEQLSDAMDDGAEQMEKTLGEGVELLNDVLQNSSHKLCESVGESLKQLNDSIRDAMNKLKQQRQQQETDPPENNGEVI
jgi:DNA anti-recombination protein RmuC